MELPVHQLSRKLRSWSNIRTLQWNSLSHWIVQGVHELGAQQAVVCIDGSRDEDWWRGLRDITCLSWHKKKSASILKDSQRPMHIRNLALVVNGVVCNQLHLQCLQCIEFPGTDQQRVIQFRGLSSYCKRHWAVSWRCSPPWQVNCCHLWKLLRPRLWNLCQSGTTTSGAS